jgi:CheY-like chemotaxis protein
MKTILIVEDEPVDVILMQRTLKKLNFAEHLSVASDEQDAIDYLAAQGQFRDRTVYPLPYVVVLDLHLPRRSGFEVLH